MMLTKRELQIMMIVWERGDVTVRAVYEEMRSQRPTTYTTVMTMMKILAEKGRLQRHRNGRAFVYRSVGTKEEAMQEILRDVADRLFGGSIELLAERLGRSR